MRDWAGKRYWITGASEGLGRALAHQLSAVGTEVVASARSEDRLQALVDELPGKAVAVPINVTDRASVEAAAERVGRIDGVVHAAGVYWPIKATEWNAEQVEAMCEVNLTGTARVMGAVVPRLLAQGGGHVVIIGSLSAYRGLPQSIGYAASKAGVASLAESMRADLAHTGIEVQLVNPGYIRTRMTAKNDFAMPFIIAPGDAARQIFEHMNGSAFARAFPFGAAAPVRLAQFLPDWAYYALFRR